MVHIEQMAMEKYGQLEQSDSAGQLAQHGQHTHDLQWRSSYNYYANLLR